jgi:glucose-1-phosphate thymidylyltransferase
VQRIEEAVILAAGEGQRLRPFTALKPKVMIPIGNKPILRYVIEAAAQNGIGKITIVVGYRKEQVIDYFGSGSEFDVEINYLEQPQQLGTGQALKQAKGKTADKFLVLSGDNIIQPNTISSLLEMEPNAILVKKQENVSKYGVIKAEDGVVTEIVEKPKEALSHLVNTGVYTFTSDIFESIEQETDLTSVIRNMIYRGHRIKTYETTGTWLDVVYPWDILKLNDLALAYTSPAVGGTIEKGVTLKGLVSIGKGTIMRSNCYVVGPATIGENCEIGPSVCILPSTSIGNDVCILPFTTITNSVIADGVEIGPSSTIQDSIIDKWCRLKGHFVSQSGEAEIRVDDEYHRVHIGTMMGESCSTEDSVIVAPGVVVGNHCQIKALKVLKDSIVDESLVM